MERGNGFEPSHPRVEALVHSLFYVTPACGRILWQEYEKSKSFHKEVKIGTITLYYYFS